MKTDYRGKRERRSKGVTVCIAAMFNWHYPNETAPGKAILTVSDRMITAGDVEYEPWQMKVSFIAPGILILVAGDYTLHSQAIKSTVDQLRGRSAIKSLDVARIYGVSIQAVQRREAEDKLLAPLGLNLDSFLAQQKEMSEAFVSSITGQLQDYVGTDVEALVVGVDSAESHIYEVDKRGTVRCYDDVGFAAIGIGGWHARSRLMQFGYVNTVTFGPALAATYAAKKAAEVAPGVGKFTDLQLITRDGVNPVLESVATKLSRLYDEYEKKHAALQAEIITKIPENIDEIPNTPSEITGSASKPETDTISNSEKTG